MNIHCDAIPPEDGTLYRYVLIREVDDLLLKLGTVLFIGCNPSSASKFRPDPTTTRCVNFTIAWGFRRMELVNPYAWRSTNPAGLLSSPDPIGPDNDRYILERALAASRVVMACGSMAKVPKRLGWERRLEQVCAMLEPHVDLWALKLTPKANMPQHPLMVPNNVEPFIWRPRRVAA